MVYLTSFLILTTFGSGRIYSNQNATRYLIITTKEFIDAVQPLKEWKTKKGVRAEVVKILSGTSRDSIKQIVKSVKPEYVLLVGDKTLIPPGDNLTAWNDLLLSDNFYGDIRADYRAEIPVGRFPCQNPTECSTMVKKTLAHQRYPLREDTLWYKKASLIFMWDPGGRPTNPIYTAEFPYDDSMMRLRYSMIDTIFNDTLFGHKGNCGVEDIIRVLNTGSSLVLYRGHAGGGWQYPFSIDPEDERLKNSSKLPVIISGSCFTIFKEPMPVGERWLRAKDDSKFSSGLKGAVAFLGTQLSGPYGRWRGKFVRTFLKAVLVEDNFILGKAFLRAKDSIATSYPNSDSNQYFYQEWSLLGDPELNLWTAVPKPMLVTYKFIDKGRKFTVQVKDSITNQPISNALVCIMSRSLDFYDYGYTNHDGRIKFHINRPIRDEISITVTAGNYVPFEKAGSGDWILASINSQRPDFKTHASIFKVYDAQGRLKANSQSSLTVNQILSNSFPPGIYFLYSKTAHFTKINKIVITK